MRRGSGSSPKGSILFGLIFLIVGIGAVFIFSRLGELSCTRIEPSAYNCVRVTKLFGVLPLDKELLPTIRQAYLSESCDSDGCSYRVEMVTDEGVFSLVNYYTGGAGAYKRQAQKADQINAFVSNSRDEELVLEADITEILLSFMPMIFVVVGAAIMVSGLRTLADNI